MTEQLPTLDRKRHEQAVVRLRRRSAFHAHLLAYVLVNACLVVTWAVTGVAFFWPIFPLLGWGIGVAFNAWDVYRPPISEDRIRREMDRLG